MKISKIKLFTAIDEAHNYKINCSFVSDENKHLYFLENDDGENSATLFTFSERPTKGQIFEKATSFFPYPWVISKPL